MIFLIVILISTIYIKFGDTFPPLVYKVDFNDEKTFVIGFDNEIKDDENEIEMIQPDELTQTYSNLRDDSKYQPLHSHVEHENRRAAEIAKKKLSNLPKNLMVMKEINVIEPRPYIADFRHNIKKSIAELRVQNHMNKIAMNMSIRNSDEYEQLTNTTAILGAVLAPFQKKSQDGDNEEDYDYNKLKAEYYQQFEDAQRNNNTFNYTVKDELESSPKDALKKIVDVKMPKNCTKEELTQFGFNAFQCLVYDYNHTKKTSDVKIVLWRTWMVIRIWLCIYIFIAIPCWCKNGWCCCCCRCDFCFPEKRIRRAKHYFALNPPGVFIQQSKTGQRDSVINYEPSILEIDAFRKLEYQIRNL